MKKRICILLALLLALHLPAARGEGTEETGYDHATIGNDTGWSNGTAAFRSTASTIPWSAGRFPERTGTATGIM